MTRPFPEYVVDFRGKDACPCLKRWLPWYEKELLRRGIIKYNIDIYQLIGNVGASAGTHSRGGAFDIGQYSPEALRVARNMGADATWARTAAQGFSPSHAHGVLRGCPHNGPARYQIYAVDAGFNGLGTGGRGGPDDGPRPLSHRTWQEGIAWAKALSEPTPVERARDIIEAVALKLEAEQKYRAARLRKALDLLPKK